MYEEDDGQFETMGDQQFATVGYDEVGAPMIMSRPMLRPGGGGAAPSSRTMRVAPGMIRRAMPQAPQAVRTVMRQPGRILPGLTEPDVRAIVTEELDARLPAWFQGASRVPGSNDQSQLMSPLGLGFGTLTPAVNIITLNASPQRPFRGERLIVSTQRSAGAALVPVRVTEFKIGENSQLVGAAALPVETFAPDAFGVRLAMSPSAPGIQILLTIVTDVGAVPGGESIVCTGAIIGRALWGESGTPGCA